MLSCVRFRFFKNDRRFEKNWNDLPVEIKMEVIKKVDPITRDRLRRCSFADLLIVKATPSIHIPYLCIFTVHTLHRLPTTKDLTDRISMRAAAAYNKTDAPIVFDISDESSAMSLPSLLGMLTSKRVSIGCLDTTALDLAHLRDIHKCFSNNATCRIDKWWIKDITMLSIKGDALCLESANIQSVEMREVALINYVHLGPEIIFCGDDLNELRRASLNSVVNWWPSQQSIAVGKNAKKFWTRILGLGNGRFVDNDPNVWRSSALGEWTARRSKCGQIVTLVSENEEEEDSSIGAIRELSDISLEDWWFLRMTSVQTERRFRVEQMKDEILEGGNGRLRKLAEKLITDY
ncbi:unnamed protein product [Caenorhabditis sp. 36 PRJEB53466]|nr:unnamed protein product [Caenorhabditis sp. 36 PRJEB53466]